jgi:hypothetical protein
MTYPAAHEASTFTMPTEIVINPGPSQIIQAEGRGPNEHAIILSTTNSTTMLTGGWSKKEA